MLTGHVWHMLSAEPRRARAMRRERESLVNVSIGLRHG